MGMDFRSWKRKQLQALCKKHGIPANLTNLEMANRLSSVLKVQEKTNEPDTGERSAANDLLDYENTMGAKEGPCIVKKVRFSPNDETFVFVSSNVKTSVKPKRITRSRLAEKVPLNRVDSPIRSTKSKAQSLAVKVVVRDVSPMIEAKRTRRSRGHNVAESAENTQERSDGAVVAEDCRVQHENMVPKKKAVEEPLSRRKSTKITARHFVALSETDISSLAHQRDGGRKLRKKVEPQKEKDEALAILDNKPADIKISGRLTRTRSRIIRETSLEVDVRSEADCLGEAGKIQQKEVPANAAPTKFKKPRTTKRNLRIETLVSSDRRGANAIQGKSNGTISRSSTSNTESLKLHTVEPTVDPAKRTPLRRSKRKPPLPAVLVNENCPGDVVYGMNLLQNHEDSPQVVVAREKVIKEPPMDMVLSHEGPSRRCRSPASNALQLHSAEVSSETIEEKQMVESGEIISKEVSSVASQSEAKSSLPGGLYNVNSPEMKSHVENSEENFDGEISAGPNTAGKGGCANQKTQHLSSHVAKGSEQLDSFSEDCGRDFPTILHNQSSQPPETTGIVVAPYITEFTLAKQGSGTCLWNLHFYQGETDGANPLTPQTVPDVCSNQESVISEKMSDPSLFGLKELFDNLGDNTEGSGDDHPEETAADIQSHPMSPTKTNVDRQQHLGTNNEDDIDHSGRLNDGQCCDALRVNDIPCCDFEPCGDSRPLEVAADPNSGISSEAKTQIFQDKYSVKKHEQGNREEVSALAQSLGSMVEKTGGSILCHSSNQKLNNSGSTHKKKQKQGQIDLEADFAWFDQELLGIEASRNCISRDQTVISGLPHSNAEKSTAKECKSVRLLEQDVHECIGNTPQASLEGFFEEASEILGIGEGRSRISTPGQGATISKDDLNVTSRTNLADKNSERLVFSKKITSSLEDRAESISQIDQNASSHLVEMEAKLTRPATPLEDMQRSICSSVELAPVEGVQWLGRALLDDNYVCSVEYSDSSGRAIQRAATEEAFGINVQEHDEVMAIQNALVVVADSQQSMTIQNAMNEERENSSNAQTHLDLGQEKIKCFAAEDLYPPFGGEEPECEVTFHTLRSDAGKKIEEEIVELSNREFSGNEEDNVVGANGSENQPTLTPDECKNANAKEANGDNDSCKSGDEAGASNPMVESRSPHTCVGCSPILSQANSANQDCSKFSDLQVEDPEFTCEMSPLPGNRMVKDDSPNMCTEDRNVGMGIENLMEESMWLLKVQEDPGAGETSNNTGMADSVAEVALADNIPAEAIKGLMDDEDSAAASAMIQEYMEREEEEDEARNVVKSPLEHNEIPTFPYSETDYLPAGLLFSENRDFNADLSSKTPVRAGLMDPDMKENADNIKTMQVPTTTTAAANKTRTKRRALEVLPNTYGV